MELRALTPALERGSEGGDDVAEGRRAEGVDGTMVPEIVAFVRALACRDRSAMGGAELAELPAERWRRAEFESADFNRRYQLFTLLGEDTTFARSRAI